jgi:hypothetical protein
MSYDRSRMISRWYYTRAFMSELGPIAAVIFIIVGLIWAAAVAGWLASCAVTLGYAPWCA